MTSEPNNDNYKLIHGGVEAKHYVRRGETTKKWDESANECIEEKLLRMEENLTGGIPLFQQVKADNDQIIEENNQIVDNLGDVLMQ